MKIAIEGQRLFRAKKHGMDIVALEMIKNLQRLDHENEYHIFVKDDIDKDCLKLKNNFHLHVLPSYPYPLWEQIILPRAVKKCGADLLHCTGNTAPLISSCPLVITLHDIIYLENNPLSKGSLYQRFGNLYRKYIVPPVIKKATSVITVSEFEKKTILKGLTFNSDKLEVVYNGVGNHFHNNYESQILEEIKAKYKLPEAFILFLGNTAPKKNLENVVKAFSRFHERNRASGLKLVIVDFSAEHLEKILKQHHLSDSLINNIHLPGYVSNVNLPILYSLAKLFLYPSLRESFGIPILESMACGTPVITSNTSSMPEVAGDAALLVDPYDVNSISDAIEQILNDTVYYSKLKTLGLQRASTFTWENTAKKVIEIYKSVKQVTTPS